VTSPDQPTEADDARGPVDPWQIAKDLTGEVRGVRTDLVAVQKWRRRFAQAASAAAVLFVVTCLLVAYFIRQNYANSAHLSQVVACTNSRNAAFVAAVNTRAQISATQSLALEKLLTQVLKASSGAEFTADVQAYISAARQLAAHPLPQYPRNACT
jgi:negative regulator of sigma E activity